MKAVLEGASGKAESGWKRYCFVFGRDPLLSFCELNSFFSAENRRFKVEAICGEFAVLCFENPINEKKVLKRLGGTTRICEILSESAEELPAGTKFFFSDSAGKVTFALSFLVQNSDFSEQELKLSAASTVRSFFREKSISAYLKGGKYGALTPTESINSGCFESGTDFFVCSIKKRVYFCRTIAIFNPAADREKDLSRPTSKHIITTSFQKARILVNLSGARKGGKFLDPFCGGGTLLMEALLKGCEVYGLDLDGQHVDIAKKNLAWTLKEFEKKGVWHVKRGDARKVSLVFREKFDSSATEPFMGPYLARRPPKGVAADVSRELHALYLDFFRSLSFCLKKGARIAFVQPIFLTKDDEVFTIGLDRILFELNKRELVYRKVNLLAGFERFLEDGALEELKSIDGVFFYPPGEHKIERKVVVLERV